MDAEHLKLLAIFHFVVAGLAVVGLGFLLLHYTLMSSVFSSPDAWKGPAQQMPPREFLAVFKWFYLLGGVFFFLAAVGNALSGFFIQERKCRVFSLVIAGLNCLQMPFGTILGVFTIIVLGRDSVRELYDAQGG